jgi:hypothetical protein
MDRWRESNEEQRTEIRSNVIAHAIRYRLVTRFTSLVAVEEKIVNPGGQSNTAAVANELPAGWNLEPVFGAPPTGTTDAFFETLGMVLLCAGAVLFLIARRVGAAS